MICYKTVWLHIHNATRQFSLSMTTKDFDMSVASLKHKDPVTFLTGFTTSEN